MQGPRTLSYNPAENAVLITSDVDGGSYELYVVPKDASGRSDSTVRVEPRRELTGNLTWALVANIWQLSPLESEEVLDLLE